MSSDQRAGYHIVTLANKEFPSESPSESLAHKFTLRTGTTAPSEKGSAVWYVHALHWQHRQGSNQKRRVDASMAVSCPQDPVRLVLLRYVRTERLAVATMVILRIPTQGATEGRELAVEWPDGASGVDSPPEWTTAGIRDYWLGGSNHTAADQEVAELILVGTPYLPYMVRAYRALLGRVARYLVGVGVEQFLDLGSGLPTAGNVHNIAQAIDPKCRVVYVDIAPDIVVEGHTVLASNDSAAVVCADLRQPEQVLDAAQRTGLLDLGAPVAVLMIDVLHHIPDTDNPVQFTQTYVEAVCPGSYLTVAHTSDGEALVSGLAMFHRFYHIPVPPLTFRNSTQLKDFFTGLDLVEPGIVPIPLWRPEQDGDVDTDPEHFPAWCGLGRKP